MDLDVAGRVGTAAGRWGGGEFFVADCSRGAGFKPDSGHGAPGFTVSELAWTFGVADLPRIEFQSFRSGITPSPIRERHTKQTNDTPVLNRRRVVHQSKEIVGIRFGAGLANCAG
ncbi:hypothetical protein CKO51_15915 [Rhodopirellula sp. SM50]|nr:hypothetical protein CKO51_15915 [Rhodopirellula sp. SM50]